MKKTLLFASLLAVHCASSADVGLGIKAGTTGGSLELTYPLTEKLNIRGGYNYFEYDDDYEDTDVTYDATLDLSSVLLLLDWHVFGGGFRISAGLVSYSDGSISGTAKPDAGLTYTVNDTVYSASDISDIRAKVEFSNSTAPYLGIGWGNAVGDGKWSFVFDLGLINVGSADASLDYQCSPSIVTDCNLFAADVQAEIDELEDEAKDYEWWPVINLGLAYKF